LITFAEVTCFRCENNFPLYRERLEHQLPIECPYCDAKLDDSASKHFKDVLYTVAELNAKLRSRHMDGRLEDLFQIDFKHVYVPIEKYRSEE
jgi:NAD-dependent SIR2 family protein deacetylase